MAEAAVTFLLENLTRLLRSYVGLITGAESELEQLKNELGWLKAFLQEAGKKQKKEKPFRELERQVREVVYDAEDTIDSCLTQAAAAQSKNLLRRRLNHKRVSLAKEVKSLRETKIKPMLDKAKVDFGKMEIGDGSHAADDKYWKKDGKIQLIRQDNVVGFEDEEGEIISYLKEPRDELDVVSITGMPGLGKTTLAWKIFQNKAIQFEFPTRIWVYVSQDFSVRDVFLKIMKGFTNQDMSSHTDQDLAQSVRACLEEGKFLLVMDDVWTVEAWNAVRDVLPKANRNGKVLITSRDRKVGTHANVTREPHNLRFLTEKECWELLQYEVFGKLNKYPKELKGIGEYIAKQCDGLPLAVVVVGGILVDQFSRTREIAAVQNAWKKVSENVSEHVKNHDKEQRISQIVELSYNKLPDELRDCFLYLGVFPEDYEIPARTLIHLWMAEGFTQHKEGQSLEESAEENLNELVSRNLVMVGKTKPSGQVKTCRVHDVIREFCNSKAAIKEQNLFQEIKMSKEGVFDPPVSELQKYRRLCIHFQLSKFLSKKQLKGPGVRSFLCFYREPTVLEPKYISTIPVAFDLLRVLDSMSFKFAQFPPKIYKLIHLRYLTLSCDDLDILPESISELWNLQTLLVDTKSRTLEIKANIWKMIRLRHLKTKAAILLAVKGEGNEACGNLQTLSRLSPEECHKQVFDWAPNIKKLGLRGRLATLLNAKYSLETLDRLESLKMVNDLFYESGSENPLRGLPQHNFFPASLKSLTLSATYLKWNHVSTLGKIHSLQVLKLKDKAFTGDTWEATGNAFRALQFLLIENADLVFWSASPEYFPVLRCLVLKNCENLREIPEGLENSLHKLSIERVSKSAVECAKKIKERKELIPEQQNPGWGGFKLKVGPGCE